MRITPLIHSYRLVLETLGPLPPDRKCFRMINGVLVERTVKDVTPALQTNSEGLKKVLEELVKQYKRQQEEMEKWKASPPSLLKRCFADSDHLFRRETIYRSFSNRPLNFDSTARKPLAASCLPSQQVLSSKAGRIVVNLQQPGIFYAYL